MPQGLAGAVSNWNALKGMRMAAENRHRALKVKEHRDLLIQSIQAHLLPVLLKQGFEVAPPTHRGPVDREFVLSFPSWGRLIRARESGVDLIEIQFAPYRRAAFRINAGVAPKKGMMTLTGQWPAEDVLVHWLNEFFEMYDSAKWRIWFSLWFWRFRSPVQSDYDKLALRVVAFLPEIELALREGRLGPHMRRVVIPRPMPAAK